EQENSGEKQVNYQCRCSFLELLSFCCCLQIYNEKIGDLLDPTQRNLKIRDDAKNGFYVENITEESVTSYDDVTQILIKGLSNRKVGATSINTKISRSHVVFTCVVESWCKHVTSSKCISSSKTKENYDVPYRSSCLTHLLQESFGGNAKLSVLCTVSPHDSTIRFGQRAKSIQNEPQINEISEDDVNEQSQLGTNQWERILSITEENFPFESLNHRG
ncbi:hypothetical protein MKW92_053614, partial [Papaver armeniacum]